MNASAALLTRRIESLESALRRRTRTALLCALLLHAVLGLAGSWFRLPARHRDNPQGLGYAGPTRLLDLSPASDAASNQEELGRRRVEGGALEAQAVPRDVWIRKEDTTGLLPREEFSAPTDTRRVDLPPVLELGEDWNAPARSSENAMSDQFQVLRIVRPEYPPAAIRAGIDGLVELEVEVDDRGIVREVRVRHGPPRGAYLEYASVAAMQQWEFKPLQRGGRTVPFTVIVPFRYRFED